MIHITVEVIDPEHGKVVKKAFNAMFKASNLIEKKSNDMNLDIIGMSWRELRENLVHNSVPKIINII